MPAWRALWTQRLRWQRGALENLGAYGLRPQTFRYWMQQLGIGYGVIALGAYLALILLMVLATRPGCGSRSGSASGLVFTLERVVTVWRGGWKARLLGLSLFPELFYAMFLNVVYVKGVWDLSLARQATWKHVVQTGSGARMEG